MEDNIAEVDSLPADGDGSSASPHQSADEVARLRGEFERRLVTANLRTEAVKAGMVDLDGLKLIDQSGIQLDSDDKIVGGRQLMDDLRRNKPWLFVAVSSSSAASVPPSQPVRPKMALDMTEEEYAAARSAVTRYKF